MSVSDMDMRVAEAPKDELETFPVPDPYRQWVEKEGVRFIEDFAFDDMGKIELTPWPRKGGSGAIINIPYHVIPNDCQVIEIAPGRSSEPERHMYEENNYVLSGSGTTSIWVDGGPKQTFEWSAGALFSIPLNSWYQHFNTSGQEPLRYISVTTAPPMFRLLGDEDVIFNSDTKFAKRFGGQADYFSGEGKLYKGRIWETNFIPDAPGMGLYGWKERGAGGINVMLRMAKNVANTHISEFPVGTYKKAHRHGVGPHLMILSGEGFSLLWTKEDMSDLRKADWKKGGMVIIPSEGCFHQHFNTGKTRARYLALHGSNMGVFVPGVNPNRADVSMKEGGNQVEYEDEDHRVHEIFEADLKEHGQECLMKAFIPWCTGSVGPTDERLT